MVGKIYENLNDGSRIQVLQDDGVFLTLSGNQRIKRELFFDRYSEVIDSSNFFKPTDLSSLAQKLNSINPNQVVDQPSGIQMIKRDANGMIIDNLVFEGPVGQSGGSVRRNNPHYGEEPQSGVRRLDSNQNQDIINEYMRRNPMADPNYYQQIDENDETAANAFLQRRHAPPTQTSQQPVYQQPVYQQPAYNDDDRLIPGASKQQVQQQPPQQPVYQQPPQQPVYQQPPQQPIYQQPPQQPVYQSTPEEEAFRFFKGFKKIYNAKIRLTFDEKIAEPEFLRMMSNNFDADIIQFNTKEIMNEIYRNPTRVEKMIYNQLSDIIYGDEKHEPDVTIKQPVVTEENKLKTVKKLKDVHQESEPTETDYKPNDTPDIYSMMPSFDPSILGVEEPEILEDEHNIITEQPVKPKRNVPFITSNDRDITEARIDNVKEEIVEKPKRKKTAK